MCVLILFFFFFFFFFFLVTGFLFINPVLIAKTLYYVHVSDHSPHSLLSEQAK